MSSEVPQGTLHEALQPLSWLVGRWRATKADVFFPTMDALSFKEELEFLPTGKPFLQYRSQTWHPTQLTLLHVESGFLTVEPGKDTVSLQMAHHFGMSEISEGKIVGNNELHLKSKALPRSSICAGDIVVEIERSFELKDQLLHGVIRMGTGKHPLQDHVYTVYEKISN